jgi:hypothetical protein
MRVTFKQLFRGIVTNLNLGGELVGLNVLVLSGSWNGDFKFPLDVRPSLRRVFRIQKAKKTDSPEPLKLANGLDNPT